MKLSVVIPAYNEQEGIADVLERVKAAAAAARDEFRDLEFVEIVVVDDGSTDATAQIVGAIDDVRLIRHPWNLGYGAALKTGFGACIGDWIAFLDADGTYPPEYLSQLLREGVSSEADMVVATRMSFQRAGMPRVRWIGNRLYAILLTRLVGERITDACSGLRLFRCASLQKLLPLPDGLDLTPAMTTRALHENMKVVEVPVPYAARTGRSKLNSVRDGLRFLQTILEVAAHYNPLRFYGIVGMTLIALAALMVALPRLVVGAVGIIPLALAALLAWGGISVVHYGALCSNALSLIYGRDMRGSDLLTRILFARKLMPHLGKLGAVLLVAGVLIVLTTLIIGGSAKTLLAGAFISGVGFQLTLGTSAIRVLSQARQTHGSPETRGQAPSNKSKGPSKPR
jgi:glycosyltransferase involved in cell wall biosynthesis